MKHSTLFFCKLSFFSSLLVLIGNKSDLEAERQVDEKAARDLADTLGIKYFETSAKTGENVNEAVEALLDQVFSFIPSLWNVRLTAPLCNNLNLL